MGTNETKLSLLAIISAYFEHEISISVDCPQKWRYLYLQLGHPLSFWLWLHSKGSRCGLDLKAQVLVKNTCILLITSPLRDPWNAKPNMIILSITLKFDIPSTAPRIPIAADSTWLAEDLISSACDYESPHITLLLIDMQPSI